MRPGWCREKHKRVRDAAVALLIVACRRILESNRQPTRFSREFLRAAGNSPTHGDGDLAARCGRNCRATFGWKPVPEISVVVNARHQLFAAPEKSAGICFAFARAMIEQLFARENY